MHIQLAKQMVQYIIDCAYQAVPNNENIKKWRRLKTWLVYTINFILIDILIRNCSFYIPVSSFFGGGLG